MIEIIKKKIVNNLFLYTLLRSPLDFLRWKKRNYLPPTPIFIKHNVIKGYLIKNSTLIETGTFKGNFIYNLHNNFLKCISIEPNNNFFLTAKKNLNHLNHKVKLYNSSSENCFEKIIKKNLNKNLTFFLDGHSISEATCTSSVEFELKIIEKYYNFFKNFVIFIDDLRCFDIEDGYPKKETLVSYCKKNNFFYNFESDMMIISNNQLKLVDFKDRRKIF